MTTTPTVPAPLSRLNSFSTWNSSSLPSSTSLLSRRTSIYSNEDRVVLDIGSRYCKIGYSGEPRPRRIVSLWRGSAAYIERKEELTEELYDLDWMRSNRNTALTETWLAETLQDVFFKYLLTDPKQRMVIICESPMMPIQLKEMIARILFYRLQVPTVSFVPGHLMALLTTASTTGLVIDCGHLETTVLPIYCARPIMTALQATAIAGRAVSDSLKSLILKHGKRIDTEPGLALALAPRLPIPENILTPSLLEDLKTTIVFVSLNNRGRTSDIFYRLDNAADHPHSSSLWIPGHVREQVMEILFTGNETEELKSVSECVLDCLLKVPSDLRRSLISSLLVIGGIGMIPGFRARILYDIQQHLAGPLYASRLGGLVDDVAFLTDSNDTAGYVFPPNTRAWVGASLVGSLKINESTITREQFDGSVPDWTSLR